MNIKLGTYKLEKDGIRYTYDSFIVNEELKYHFFIATNIENSKSLIELRLGKGYLDKKIAINILKNLGIDLIGD